MELEELFGIELKGRSQALSRQEGGSGFAIPLVKIFPHFCMV